MLRRSPAGSCARIVIAGVLLPVKRSSRSTTHGSPSPCAMISRGHPGRFGGIGPAAVQDIDGRWAGPHARLRDADELHILGVPLVGSSTGSSLASYPTVRSNSDVRSAMKKLRGGKRYYGGLRKTATAFSIDLEPPRWYDLWHQHFDRCGYSRQSRRARVQHLNALFTAFRRALEQASGATTPVQIFVSIAPESEAEQDALYVHTPNPNGTPFPHPFEGVQWNVLPPPVLRAFVEGEPWEVGAATGEWSGWWIVRPLRGVR